MIISLLFNRVEKLEAGPNEEPRCLCNGVWYIDLGGGKYMKFLVTSLKESQATSIIGRDERGWRA
jgi:hypothetical protein